jgi:hypothetical protein
MPMTPKAATCAHHRAPCFHRASDQGLAEYHIARVLHVIGPLDSGNEGSKCVSVTWTWRATRAE